MGMYSTRADTLSLQERLAAERPRILRLCTYWLGDAGMAEDATQETLIEAWRHFARLQEPKAFRGWLSGIARNICARRGRSNQREFNRTAHSLDVNPTLPLEAEEDSLAVELERHELATMLDRALALLPDDARTILVQKYLEESPNEEIAAFLGLNPNATAVRLHRGKMALRAVLANHFASESATLGLDLPPTEGQKTTIWCPTCGMERLVGKWDRHEFMLRCPTCHQEPNTFHAQSRSTTIFEGLKAYRPALNRFSTWMDGYFRQALTTKIVLCQRCKHPTPLRQGFPAYAPASVQAQRGLHVLCDHCGAGSYETLDDLALGLPEGRAFFRNHPRIHVLPQQEMEYAGSPALLLGYASHTDSATFHVIVNEESYEIITVPGVAYE